MRAAYKGQLVTLKALLSKRADVNARGPGSVTALLLAVLNGNTDAAKLLIEGGADVNAKSDDGGTPLMGAAAIGEPELVQMLLARGADVNAKNVKGQTALQIVRYRWPSAQTVIKLLEDAEKKQYDTVKN